MYHVMMRHDESTWQKDREKNQKKVLVYRSPTLVDLVFCF